ncbi:MAG: helix-turn-helix transcriptional regulator [Hassallia sp. WJT32-NPBG1]|nr:helix-turn-helix transcriptional regulator [Hassallia sp. WJT32-NPBG1]
MPDASKPILSLLLYFESGYSSFKIGVLLMQARIEAGVTQEELAHRFNLHQSTIVSIENDGSDVAISILERYANALGKKFYIDIK